MECALDTLLGSRLCLELTLWETLGQGALALPLQEGTPTAAASHVLVSWSLAASACLPPGSLFPAPSPMGDVLQSL